MSCYHDALLTMRKNVLAALAMLRDRHSDGEILVTGYWNVFLDGRVGASRGEAYVRDSAALTAQVNSALKEAATRSSATFVDLYTPFHNSPDESSLLASDGDHLSAAGHRLVTRTLLRSLRPTS